MSPKQPDLFETVPYAYYAEQNQAIVYAEFEAAIEAWEKRTGLRVERQFSSGKRVQLNKTTTVTEYLGKEWKNFGMFLGSREANKYRQENPMTFDEMMTEFEKLKTSKPDMIIEGEEDDNTEERDCGSAPAAESD